MSDHRFVVCYVVWRQRFRAVGGSSAQRFRGLRRVAVVDVVTAPADYAAAPTFESFFAAEYGRVVGLAFVLCGRRAVAEEVAQDAFVQAYRRWSVVSGYDDPGAWVRRVAVNLATSTLRRRTREARALTRLAARRTAPAELVVTNETFWEAVRHLPKRQAQCVALHYLEDRSVAESPPCSTSPRPPSGAISTTAEPLWRYRSTCTSRRRSMNLDQLARDAGAEVRDQVATIEPPTPDVIARRSRRGRMATGVAAIAVLALAGVGLAVALQDDPAPTRLQVTDDPATRRRRFRPMAGWHRSTASQQLERYGAASGPEEVLEGTGTQACPAFSPDGERLMFGREDDEGNGLPGGRQRGRGWPGLAASTIPIDGIEDSRQAIPCRVWAPDGRWAALGGGGSVWVVDTETAEVRQLPVSDATDLEWRPGTDELAITGQPGQTPTPRSTSTPSAPASSAPSTASRRSEFTWSPDGTTIAYSQGVPGAADTMSGISLVDADGTNRRTLTTADWVEQGIGPVWSPRGDQIVYQRDAADCADPACYERSEVSSSPRPTMTPTTRSEPSAPSRRIPNDFYGEPGINPRWWYANSVTWSPDGTELLYSGNPGLLRVPVDHPRRPIVLSGAPPTCTPTTRPSPGSRFRRGSRSRNRADESSARYWFRTSGLCRVKAIQGLPSTSGRYRIGPRSPVSRGSEVRLPPGTSGCYWKSRGLGRGLRATPSAGAWLDIAATTGTSFTTASRQNRVIVSADTDFGTSSPRTGARTGRRPKTSPRRSSSPAPAAPVSRPRRRRGVAPRRRARRKLVDHWRARTREDRKLALVHAAEPSPRPRRARRRRGGNGRPGRAQPDLPGGARAAPRRRPCRSPRSPRTSDARSKPPSRC